MIRNQRVIITGGLGFIGSHLASRLSTDNEVTIVDDVSSGSLRNIEHLPRDHISVIKRSVASSDLRSIFEGCDYVFHEAAMASVPGSVQDPMGCHHTNVTGTLNVLDASRDAGVKKVIFASSSSVYGDTAILPAAETLPVRPMSPYAVTKAAAEMYSNVYREIYGLNTIALRYFNVFGPRQDPHSQYAAVIPSFITAMLRDERPVVYGDGEQSRDFTFVGHVVDANLLACEFGLSGVYNVACGRRITINRLISLINDLLGKDIKPIYKDARPGDIKHSMADITRARAFRFDPKGDFKEELRETIAACKANMEKERASWTSSSSAIQSSAQ